MAEKGVCVWCRQVRVIYDRHGRCRACHRYFASIRED